MSKELWNERYANDEYQYGIEPNEFLKSQLESIKPGKILFPGEGEGRNAVYAASIGWKVLAFDQSETGRNKAMKLALQKNVVIDYEIATLQEWAGNEEDFDVIALIYIHMPPVLRNEIHKKMIRCLKHGGLIILEAFNKKQLQYNSGGPRDAEMLFSKEILQEDFSSLNIKYLQEKEIKLHEGRHHEGIAEVVRFAGQKV